MKVSDPDAAQHTELTEAGGARQLQFPQQLVLKGAQIAMPEIAQLEVQLPHRGHL